MQTNNENKKTREFIGEVISTAMNKTVVVRVDNWKMNEKYQKRYRASVKFHVHDENGAAKTGDIARFVECRPISKTKKWRLIEIIKK